MAIELGELGGPAERSERLVRPPQRGEGVAVPRLQLGL